VHKLIEKLRQNSGQLEHLRKERAERFNEEYQDPEEFVVNWLELQAQADSSYDAKLDVQLVKQLGMHALGPLIDNYEQIVAQLKHELTSTKERLRRQNEIS
jgi:hypothetical protein